MNGLMIDSSTRSKWKWLAAPGSFLKMIKTPKRQRAVSIFPSLDDDYMAPTFEAINYRSVKFAIMGKYIHFWVPESVPSTKTEEYIFKNILNRNFLKAFNKA